MTLSKFEGDTIPVSVLELDPHTDDLVDYTSYPSLMKLWSHTELVSQVNKESQPDIWSRWLTWAVPPYANLEALYESETTAQQLSCLESLLFIVL